MDESDTSATAKTERHIKTPGLDGLDPGGLLREVSEPSDTGYEEPKLDTVQWESHTIGRYSIQRRIGKGGFGEVFLAIDKSLNRQVAIKVIERRISDSDTNLLDEPRAIAQLEHPGIVTIHDVGQEGDQLFFVANFIDGRTLARWVQEEERSPEAIATIIGDVADALAYAHERNIIHRDIKPSNILVTPEGQPVLIDFGIAIVSESSPFAQFGSITGTPGYMSPEQARGESHLVDGRSDVFSLGVVLYELLTGMLPFRGRSEDQIDLIASPTEEAESVRNLNSGVPKALERICLKALAKRAADRYGSATEFEDELRAFVVSGKEKPAGITHTHTQAGGPVIPKGLRSFDREDSDFFLQLLPGLRDREGIPDGIRFWERGIENTIDPFRVGILYGPSGSGKSSFLKAGLIPLLSKSTEVIYLAADAENTEAVLLERLQRRFDSLAGEGKLTDCIRRIREEKLVKGSEKLLIVVDQFEQWLHANGRSPGSDLVSALRQSDGRRIQFILTVRDDFWLAIGQLMEDIDVDLLQSRNAAAIDLFDRPHARRVLIDFGRAHGGFPAGGEALTNGQEEFVRAALNDMEQDGKIIPLQLALFAEMAKNVEWTIDSYNRLGGTTAIGVEFLNAVFTNPAHRSIEKPARALLEALLPAGESKIRGRSLTEDELKEKSGVTDGFTRIIKILDGELRLVTPVDVSEGGSNDDDGPQEKRYQLTHDYLVPSLRDWLYQNRRSTPRGRSQIRLKELAASWSASRDKRHLPSFWEWIRIRLLTSRKMWDRNDRALMTRAGRKHGRQIAIVAAILIVSGIWAGIETSIRHTASKILRADLEEVPRLVSRTGSRKGAVIRFLRGEVEREALTEEERLKAALAVLPEEPGESEFLFETLYSPRTDLAVCQAFTSALVQNELTGDFLTRAWNQIESSDVSASEKLRLAIFLSVADRDSPRWQLNSQRAFRWLLSAPEIEVEDWCRPLQKYLERHFDTFLLQDLPAANVEDTQRKMAIILAEIAAETGNVEGLLSLYYQVDPANLRFVLVRFDSFRDEVIARLESKLNEDSSIDVSPPERRDRIAEQQGRAGAALVALNGFTSPLVLEQLRHRGEPSWRTYLVHYLPRAGVNPLVVLKQLDREIDENRDTSRQLGSIQRRRALVLALGLFNQEMIPVEVNRQVLDWLEDRFLNDPDPGVHSAIGWSMQRWQRSQDKTLPSIRPGERKTSVIGNSNPIAAGWMKNSQGATFLLLRIWGKTRPQ